MTTTNDLPEAKYQILRAIMQLKDNSKSVDSVVAQLSAYLKQTADETQPKNDQLRNELQTILTELTQLGRMLTHKQYNSARNHHIAIYQHVERIIKELKDDPQSGNKD